VIDFTVSQEDGEKFSVKATARDVLAWEKTTKSASLKALMEDLRISDLYKVAFHAARRTGQFAGTMQEFERDCDLEFDLDGGDEDPTRSAR